MPNISGGRFQVYYERIKQELKKIKEENNYLNLSKAFAHWYLNNFLDIQEIDLGEIIFDGDGDNGIDAAIIQNGYMDLYQFKFPEKSENITKKIDETTALKLLNGYKKLNSNSKPRKANEVFLAFKERVKTENIFRYTFTFVCYTEELSDHAKDALDVEIERIKRETGNAISVEVDDKRKICDKFDRKQHRNSLNIELKYGQLTQSYNKGTDVKSWTGFAKAQDIINSCKEYMDVIFDENIRNYEGDNSVNQGIIKTATSSDESVNFYFYHNGIVFISDKCEVSTGNQIVSLGSASIVNGCQTVVSLKKAFDQNTLKDEVFLPIRIIETSDIDLRGHITEYLNSQTKIRDSYFLSNHAFIRALQDGLAEKGYFMERLANEYNYKRSLDKIKEYPKNKVLPLEKVIQVYVAYYVNKYAAAAKRGKNDLFDKDIIDDLIQGISADKVIESYSIYEKITKVITKYRKCKRAEKNEEFLDSIGVENLTDEEYSIKMDEYVFMNTADLLLLNAYNNLAGDGNFETKIRKAILVCKNVLDENKKMAPSSATKNSSIFEAVQNKAKES